MGLRTPAVTNFVVFHPFIVEISWKISLKEPQMQVTFLSFQETSSRGYFVIATQDKVVSELKRKQVT